MSLTVNAGAPPAEQPASLVSGGFHRAPAESRITSRTASRCRLRRSPRRRPSAAERLLRGAWTRVRVRAGARERDSHRTSGRHRRPRHAADRVWRWDSVRSKSVCSSSPYCCPSPRRVSSAGCGSAISVASGPGRSGEPSRPFFMRVGRSSPAGWRGSSHAPAGRRSFGPAARFSPPSGSAGDRRSSG